MKVSVIIPVYKVEKYIERCVRSLFGQTLDDIEYIFIDDCSPDRSIAVMENVLNEFPNRKESVKVIRLPQNRGQAYGRKIGIQNCSGEYIIHCDGDDWVEPEMYEKMYDYAVLGNYDLVKCNFYRQFADYTRVCKTIPTEFYDDRLQVISKMLLGNELTSLVDKMVKRDVVLSQNIIWPVTNMQEDHVLSLQYFFYSRRIGYLPEVFYHYCYNRDSTTRTNSMPDYESRFKQVCQNTDVIVDFLKEQKLEEKLNSEILCQKFRCKNHLLKVLDVNSFARMWLETYPEVNYKFLFAKKIAPKEKIRFILIRAKIFFILAKKSFVKLSV